MKEDIKKLCQLRGVIVEVISKPKLTECLSKELDELDMSIREPLRTIDDYIALANELENAITKTVFIESLLVDHDEIDYANGKMVFTSNLSAVFRRIHCAVVVNGHCLVSVHSTSGLWLLTLMPYLTSLTLVLDETKCSVIINKLDNTTDSNQGIFNQPTSPYKGMKAWSENADFTFTKKPSKT